MHSLEPASLAAGAGEDRAALSGHPRKANAGQYAGVMQQREPTRNHDATTPSARKRVAHAPRKRESAPTFPSGRALLLEVVASDQRVIFDVPSDP
jgi:hypothetical protein